MFKNYKTSLLKNIVESGLINVKGFSFLNVNSTNFYNKKSFLDLLQMNKDFKQLYFLLKLVQKQKNSIIYLYISDQHLYNAINSYFNDKFDIKKFILINSIHRLEENDSPKILISLEKYLYDLRYLHKKGFKIICYCNLIKFRDNNSYNFFFDISFFIHFLFVFLFFFKFNLI